MMPNDLPPWDTVYQQARRWMGAGVFESMVHDLRELLCMAQEHDPDPSAVVIDSCTLHRAPESGRRAGCDGAKRRKGGKVHVAVDMLGHLLAPRVTPASDGDREQVGRLPKDVQEATGESVCVGFVDQRGTPGTGPRRPPRVTGSSWWS